MSPYSYFFKNSASSTLQSVLPRLIQGHPRKNRKVIALQRFFGISKNNKIPQKVDVVLSET